MTAGPPGDAGGSRTIRRPLVLGGAGFLGGCLVRVLGAAGMDPLVVDDLSTGRRERAGGSRLVVADVRWPGLGDLMVEQDVDCVFHLATAAYVPPSVDDPLTDLSHNVGTTLAVLEAARRCPRPPLVVLASSAAVYGEGVRQPIREDDPLEPVSPYGVSKLAAEGYLRLYARLHGVAGVAIRMFSLYGPGQRKQVVYDLLTRALGGERPLRVLGLPNASRDLVYVDDAAAAFLTIARAAPATGEPYNLASGRGTTIEELARAVLRSAGVDADVVFDGIPRPGDPLAWLGDAGAAAALGVTCPKPLEEGLRRTADWVRAEGGADAAGRTMTP